jgi:hypothetical protein
VFKRLLKPATHKQQPHSSHSNALYHTTSIDLMDCLAMCNEK